VSIQVPTRQSTLIDTFHLRHFVRTTFTSNATTIGDHVYASEEIHEISSPYGHFYTKIHILTNRVCALVHMKEHVHNMTALIAITNAAMHCRSPTAPQLT
jgi:hypothetical protein